MYHIILCLLPTLLSIACGRLRQSPDDSGLWQIRAAHLSQPAIIPCAAEPRARSTKTVNIKPSKHLTGYSSLRILVLYGTIRSAYGTAVLGD